MDDRLQSLVRKRDSLQSKKSRLVGKLEAAKKSLSDLEEECNQKGIPFDKLEETLEKLKSKYDEELQEFEKNLADVEKKLEPYVKEISYDF